MRKITCLLLFINSVLGAGAQQDTGRAGSFTGNPGDTLRPASFSTTGKPVTGIAAVYDADLDGIKTSTGEVFLNIRLTAGSNNFGLNSWIKVTNPDNRKYVILRVNDRLSSRQKKKGVTLNLTQEAGKILGMTKDHAIKVKIESIQITNSESFTKNLPDTIARPGIVIRKVDSLTPNTFRAFGKAILGIASFYSYNLDGTLTSTGERYRNSKLTAASNNFKLNTWVLVTNLRNKKSVIVRINDHMHPRMKEKGRVVDLSREAARLLDFMENGLAKVKVQPVKFIFSPAVKEKLDSIYERSDSSKVKDSLMTDSVKTTAGFVPGRGNVNRVRLDSPPAITSEMPSNDRMYAANNNGNLDIQMRITDLCIPMPAERGYGNLPEAACICLPEDGFVEQKRHLLPVVNGAAGK